MGGPPVKTIVGSICVALLVCLGANIAFTFLIVSTQKEDRVEGGKLVSAETGEILQVGGGELQVTNNGLLVSSQCAKGGNCALTKNATQKAVSVTTQKVKQSISSIIPDNLFEELQSIQIFSTDQDSKLILDVTGFMRVSSPGSVCGTVVNVMTDIGMVIFDDKRILFDAKAQAVLDDNGFTLDETKGGLGFFNFFESFEWKCAEPKGGRRLSTGPKFFERPFKVVMTQQHPCHALEMCVSDVKDGKGGLMMKPGYVAATHSFTSKVEHIETDTHSIKLTILPNHPLTTFVEVVDFANEEHYMYQQDELGNAFYCTEAKKPDKDFFATDLSATYEAVLNGHKSGPNASPLREYTMIPRNKSSDALQWTYAEYAHDSKPYSIRFAQSRSLEMPTEAAFIDSYTRPTADETAKFVSKYKKKCLSEAERLSKKILDPPKVDEMKGPTQESGKAILYYLDGMEVEICEPYHDKGEACPFADVTKKYGIFWGTLMEMWHANRAFLSEQGVENPKNQKHQSIGQSNHKNASDPNHRKLLADDADSSAVAPTLPRQAGAEERAFIEPEVQRNATTPRRLQEVCASENGQCDCPKGTVYYGRKYVGGPPGSGILANLDELKMVGYTQMMGPIDCNNNAMGGDPLPGYYKQCICLKYPVAPKGSHACPEGGCPCGANMEPPKNYVPVAGAGDCLCTGSGTGRNSCGTLCCAASPHTDPCGGTYPAASASSLCYKKGVVQADGTTSDEMKIALASTIEIPIPSSSMMDGLAKSTLLGGTVESCKIIIAFGPQGMTGTNPVPTGYCIGAAITPACSNKPPGVYIAGGFTYCANAGGVWAQGFTGTFCLGYAWGVVYSKKIKILFWSKTVTLSASLTTYGCLTVTIGQTDVSRRRGCCGRRRRRNMIKTTSYGATINIEGQISIPGISVSVGGGFTFAMGPCGRYMSPEMKFQVAAKGCLKIGPFNGCIGFPVTTLYSKDLGSCNR